MEREIGNKLICIQPRPKKENIPCLSIFIDSYHKCCQTSAIDKLNQVVQERQWQQFLCRPRNGLYMDNGLKDMFL